jgi:hypothetical protein
MAPPSGGLYGNTIFGGESMVKFANKGYLIFFMENIHKLSLNTLNS